MSKQTIWNFFKENTALSDEAIAGIMGNFEAESNNEACRVQGDFTADRRVSKQYAANVNSGAISAASFARDSKGFGLAQWTYWSRKENLLKCCASYGVGIENEEAQLWFFLSEMQNEYIGVWKGLLNCNSIYTAASLVCCDYERPAVNNIAARADYGKTIYNQFHGKDTTPEPEPTPSPAPVDDVDLAIEYIEKALAIIKSFKEIKK